MDDVVEGPSPLIEALQAGAQLDEIQEILREDTQLLQVRDEEGRYPLYRAVEWRAPLPVMECLADGFPDAMLASPTWLRGWTPLFLAVSEGSPTEVVQLLIDKGPKALEEKDDGGRQPLHKACECGADGSVVRVLLDNFPAAVKVQDIRGLYPLHHAARGRQWEVVQMLRDAYPKALEVKCKNGCLPLHLSTKVGASMVTHCLLKGYREGLRTKNRSGKLPLHCAAGSDNCTEELVRLLATEEPSALREKDANGLLPLQVAAQNRNAPAEALDCLKDMFPDALWARDTDSRLLLHIAAWRGNLDVVRLVEGWHPKAVKVKCTVHGRLPLHYAAMHYLYDRKNVMKFLVRKYPEAVMIKDGEGQLPLHRAANACATLEGLEYLVRKGPLALRTKDGAGRLPLHKAAECNEVEPVEYLTDEFRDALTTKDVNGWLPVHVAIAKEKHPEGMGINGMEDATDEEILDEQDDHVVVYLTSVSPHQATDAEGWYPAHVAARFATRAPVARVVVNAYPAALNIVDDQGRLPIHLAAQHARLPVLNEFAITGPTALTKTDWDGRRPVHLAAEHNTPEAVQFLAGMDPGALLVKTSTDGSVPLHVAAQRGSLGGVEPLVTLCPKALKVKDKNGFLPIHRSAMNDAPLETIYLLARTSPDSLQRPGGMRFVAAAAAALLANVVDDGPRKRLRLSVEVPPE